MKRTLFFVLLAMTWAAVSCHTGKKTVKSPPPVEDELSKYPLHFIRSDYLSDVLETAKRDNKLVFVDMYADWCAPCKVMDEELYMDESFAEIINANFVSYKVNVEKENGTNLSTIFEVRVLPTLLFLDADGNVLQRSDGALSRSQFLQMADQAVMMSGR